MVQKTLLLVLLFSVVGALFSGYLTFSILFGDGCPLQEPCPLFLGWPACAFGFDLFILSLLAGVVLLFKRREKVIWFLIVVTLAGVLFSGYFSVLELVSPSCIGECVYELGLPSCVWGFFVFVIVFVAAVGLKRTRSSD